jgi:hypothetical protein
MYLFLPGSCCLKFADQHGPDQFEALLADQNSTDDSVEAFSEQLVEVD